MAKRNIANTGHSEAHPILSLPFVADLPDPEKPKQTCRVFWNIPLDADYVEACRMGRRWGAQFIAYSRTRDLPALALIVGGILERERQLAPQSGSIGFRIGFCEALEALACLGSEAAGGEDKWLAGVEEFYREAETEREVERRAQSAVRVTRMNAARAAKAKAMKAKATVDGKAA